MKKLFVYSTLIIVAITFSACGKKEKNIYLGEGIETEMPSETESKFSAVKQKSKANQTRKVTPETEVTANPQVTVPSTAKETTAAMVETQTTTETQPSTEPQTTPESKSTPEDSYGITFNDDGSVTVSQEILSKLAEEETELIDALGLTDEQVEILTTNGDLTLSPELQSKLLDFLDTLSFTEKLRLLGKLANLMEE